MPDHLSHYDLLDKLGVGGMGTVWRARDRRDGSIVAVKVLHPHLAADDEYVRRFQREVRIAQGIDSPHVVKVLDSGADGDSYFLVMEYVAGETLAQLVHKRGRLPIDEAVGIARDVARGLAAAHARGVVHRDVSPQNVIITGIGAVKLTDFGVARDLAATAMTATSMLLGKPEYIAPEVVTGRVKPDIRADIYALGVVLYQMLAGSVPFHSETPYAVLMQQINDTPPDIATVRKDAPPWLASVIARCLAKLPEQRFQEPMALVSALEARMVLPLPGATPVSRRPAPVASRQRSGGSGRWLVLGGAVGGLVAALAVVGLVFMQSGQEEKAAGGDAGPGLPAVVAPVDTPVPQPTRPPIPTIVPSRVCPTTAPANDAEFFKGCRIFEARLDGTTASFQEPRFYGVCGPNPRNNAEPQLTDISYFPNLVEYTVHQRYGQTNVPFNLPPRQTYVVEYDLQFKPGSNIEALFGMRTQNEKNVNLTLLPQNNTVHMWLYDSNARTATDLTSRVQIPGLRDGRRITLTIAVNVDRYTAFIDGKQVLDLQDNRVTGSRRPTIQVQSCGGAGAASGAGTLQLLGARIYEIGGQ